MNQLERLNRGLKILTDAGSDNVATGHDKIYVGGDTLILSHADEEELRELGWFYEADFDSWGLYV